jgi:hypothetical protein
VARPVTSCAFPTDPRERIAGSHSMVVKPDLSNSMATFSHRVLMICNICNNITLQ